MVVLADGSLFGTIGGGAGEKLTVDLCRKAIRDNQPQLVEYQLSGKKKGQPICGGKEKIFIEPFARQKHLLLCGAGHIALPLSVLAKILNFSVTVIDDRPDFANKIRFPHVDQIFCGKHNDILKQVVITPSTFIVILTQDHNRDFTCLKSALRSAAKYIGVISSRLKRKKFLTLLKTNKVKNIAQRLRMPVGLDLGAQTPEEIAISIMAEIVKEYQKNTLNSLKFSEKFKYASHG